MKVITVLKEVVQTAAAAVKTLECSICLDILTMPVAAGCGHCFCRKCVSRILLSSYRAPCPLCKRSFTRRGVCDSHLKHAVITCAKALAEDCNSMTVDDLLCLKYSEGSKEFMDVSAVSPEKNKSLIKETKDVLSKKRKSCENEGPDTCVDSSLLASDMKELSDENKSIDGTTTDKLPSAKKKTKSSYKNIDAEENELPSMEDLLFEIETSSKKSARVVLKNIVVDELPNITPPHKVPKLKTYSEYQKKLRNKQKVISATSDCSETDKEEANAEVMELMTFEEINDIDVQNCTNDLQNTTMKKTSKECAKLKRINALNKTNEVESSLLILKDDGFLAKAKGIADKTSKIEHETILKQNEICSKPRVISCHLNKNQKLKKNKAKLYNLRKKSSLSIDDDDKLCTEINETISHELLGENALEMSGKETQHKSFNDSYKAIGLTDTAVSVDSVTSPLATKPISLHKKSPGWSRVKEVKKDFKMRQFSSLPIEKSSPSFGNKHYVLSANSIPQINIDGAEGKKLEFDHQHELSCEMKEVNNENSVRPVNNIAETSFSDQISVNPLRHELQLNKVVTISGTDESHNEFIDPMDINMNDAANCQEKGKEIECANVAVENNAENNVSDINVNKNNFLVSKNLNGNRKIIDSYVPQISSSEILSPTHMNDTFNSAGKSSFININNEISQKNENFGELNVVKTSTSTCEDNGNDKVIYKQSVTLCDDSANSFCGHDIPKLRKEKTVTLQACISEYESYDSQMVCKNKEIQHVEHSQQTSQMQYNFEHVNPMYKHFPLSVQQPHQQFCTNANLVKTKVVKRTCLTLDEIQDCFIKSSQSGCSEIIYSSPFLCDQFKLDVRVSDETLNISILKIVDTRTENDAALSATSTINEKSVQVSDGLCHALSPTVLPPSNSSSQPDYSNADPYPYLNKFSSVEHLQPKSVFQEGVDVHTVESSAKEMEALESHQEPACHIETNERDEENAKDNFNISDIVHYPSISTIEINKKITNGRNEGVQDWSDSSVQCYEISSDKILKTNSPHYQNDLGVTISEISKEVVENSIDICLKDSSKDYKEASQSSSSQSMIKSKFTINSEVDGLSDSDGEVTLKVLKQCINKEPVTKKQNRLSLREKFRKIEVYDSSEESDAENHELTKNSLSRNFTCTTIADKPLGEILAYAKNLQDPNMSARDQKSETLEMPCTLNSILSEDAPDANASEIVLEIEDLSDKIKSLEEKLKQCGHADLLKNNAQKSCHNESKCTSENLNHLHESDSEDLFSQSVPPTPPEKCGSDVSPGYKSSFYNDN